MSSLATGSESRPLVIAVTAVEPSGDMHGAELVRAIRAIHPNCRFVGVGLKAMADAGVDCWINPANLSTIGVGGALVSLPVMMRCYAKYRRMVLEHRPDFSVMIDAPAFHMRLGAVLRKNGLRSAYYFPPSAWTKSAKRMHSVYERTDAVLCTFPGNAKFYQSLGLDVAFYGHPILDILAKVPEPSQARQALGVKGKALAVLPGSRKHEIGLLLPLFLQAAALLKKQFADMEVLIPSVSDELGQFMSGYLADYPYVRLVAGQSRQVMAACRAGILCSGTASLEAALLGLPCAICYRFGPVDALLGRLLLAAGLLHVEHIGLPNLILNKRALPELLQEQVTPQAISEYVASVWQDGPGREQVLGDLTMVRQGLGQVGATEKLARIVEQMALGSSLGMAKQVLESELG